VFCDNSGLPFARVREGESLTVDRPEGEEGEDLRQSVEKSQNHQGEGQPAARAKACGHGNLENKLDRQHWSAAAVTEPLALPLLVRTIIAAELTVFRSHKARDSYHTPQISGSSSIRNLLATFSVSAI